MTAFGSAIEIDDAWNSAVQNYEQSITQDEYLGRAPTDMGVEFDEVARRNYELNASNTLLAVREHEFFGGLRDFLRDCQERYIEETASDLFMGDIDPRLQAKTYDSAVNKSYRQNVVWNDEWPVEPQEGWVTPNNWFTKLNDIIRGTLVCKYIDGPRFLADCLRDRANESGLDCDITSKQRDEGYYAYHFYVQIPVELVDTEWTAFSVNLDVELQLTTQLQEVMYNITHQYYEHTRDHRSGDPSGWKWEVTSNRFRAGYLNAWCELSSPSQQVGEG